MTRRLSILLISLATGLWTLPSLADNPIIKDRFTADPAALVHNGKVYLYAGHDEAKEDGDFFVMNEWVIYSSANMKDWKREGSLSRTEFDWARRPTAWASQAVERDGKFYWYVTVLNDAPNNDSQNGFAIGVAVSDKPAEGFKDALGGPLVRSDMTEAPDHMHKHETWDDIDPTVYIDDDEQAYLYWGNSHLYYAKLKDNMVELDGEIHRVEIQDMPGTFTEGPYLHRHNQTYYMTFAMDYPEKLAYATAENLTGPWTYQGQLLDVLPGTGTSHPAQVHFKDQWYFIYHTAALPTGGNYRRSVSVETFEHNEDGSIDPLTPTASGVGFDPYRLKTPEENRAYWQHSEDGVRLAENQAPDYDTQWHLSPSLADGSENTVSFQAENRPGYYLRRTDKNTLTLAKHDGSEAFEVDASYQKVKGLSDTSGWSFHPIDNPNHFIVRDEEGALRMESVETADQHKATFHLEAVK